MNIRKGHILVARKDFTSMDCDCDEVNSDRVLTEDKHYEIVDVNGDAEIYFINDRKNKDFFLDDGDLDDPHHFSKFFYTMKEVRQIKLKELGI